MTGLSGGDTIDGVQVNKLLLDTPAALLYEEVKISTLTTIKHTWMNKLAQLLTHVSQVDRKKKIAPQIYITTSSCLLFIK